MHAANVRDRPQEILSTSPRTSYDVALMTDALRDVVQMFIP